MKPSFTKQLIANVAMIALISGVIFTNRVIAEPDDTVAEETSVFLTSAALGL